MKVLPPLDALAPLGRVTGTVFAVRLHTSYVRRVYKECPPTAAQIYQRTVWTEVDLAWQALPPTSKAIWRRWKYWYRLWAYSLFMKVNVPRRRSGLPLLLLPPDYPPWV